MSSTAKDVLDALKEVADPVKAEHSKRFFKSGPGEYGEGDKFLGIKVPEQRKIAKRYKDLPLKELTKLLRSKWHEGRLTACYITVLQYKMGTEEHKEALFQMYINNTEYVSGWDLVDSSAHSVVGPHLPPDRRDLLDRLATSDMLWERRIAMIATYHYIKQEQFEDALRIAEVLVHDEHDLIQKAVGWMLREVGNRNRDAEEAFLQEHYHTMPRTMLRYAIEKFPEPLRKAYLEGRA